jgi:integrase
MIARNPFTASRLTTLQAEKGARDTAAATTIRSVQKQSSPVSTVEIPAYRVHRAKGLGYVRLAKRMVYCGKANTPQSFERYRQVVGEWLATGHVRDSGTRRRTEQLTVSQLVDQYLNWARSYYQCNAGALAPGLGPVEAAARIMLSLYASLPACDFGPVALKAVRHAMIASNLCRNVINQRVGCIKRIFRWAVSEELVPPDVLQSLIAVEPLRRGRSGARETGPVRPVPDEYVRPVLDYLPPTLRAMVQLQRLTGMRSGELCVMRPCDIDTQREVWIYRPMQHKTAYRGHERTVWIGPKAQAVLQTLLNRAPAGGFVFSPERAQEERKKHRDRKARDVGPISSSRRYDPRSYRRALSYAMQHAIRDGALLRDQRWHPHQLRHRHATEIRQARGLEAARVLLGHRTLSQTLEYAEADAGLASVLALELG